MLLTKFTKGFTLIEILITVTIISVLAAIGLVTYSTILKNSRDNRRLSDLKLIQSALEDYHADQIYYPVNITFGSPLTNLTGRPTPSPAPSPKTYLNSVPSDPLPSPQPQYSYRPLPNTCDNGSNTNNCTSYCLYAKTEDPAPTTDPGCSPAPSPYNYGVTRP